MKKKSKDERLQLKTSLCDFRDTLLVVAGDDEFIRLYDTDSQKCLCEFKAHETRVKSLYSFDYKGSPILVSSSSDGYVKMWRLDLNKMNSEPTLLSEVSTSARLTCLSVWYPGVSENKRYKSDPETSEKVSECPKKKRKVPKEQTEETSTKPQSEDQTMRKKRKRTDKLKTPTMKHNKD
ncbi:unnamed protein product [Ranitomeya imitator]|uniref:Uncharacterized protein n=1 Tax=Ranitomeya imitator TaxID=111125 RepID=A0ABN9M002_9NEOB|nr:unnamed protein product [Ranitomeya imitator]